jgi:hypothetical protein
MERKKGRAGNGEVEGEERDREERGRGQGSENRKKEVSKKKLILTKQTFVFRIQMRILIHRLLSFN